MPANLVPTTKVILPSTDTWRDTMIVRPLLLMSPFALTGWFAGGLVPIKGGGLRFGLYVSRVGMGIWLELAFVRDESH